MLLLHGGGQTRWCSELVDEEVAREFLELVPHAGYAKVADTRHMVAGDSNDDFADAVIEFLATLD